MPEREMVRGELEASETTEMLPVTLPVAFGALSIPLSGTGTTPPGLLQASYSTISFGSVQMGNSSARSETLSNSGDSAVSITQANLTGSAFNGEL